jgi:hypothetical protein
MAATTRRPTVRRAFARLVVAVLLALTAVLATAAPASAADVPIGNRFYMVFLAEIRAVDETGPINTGVSDEIYAGFRTTQGTGLRSETQTRLFGDVDAGEVREVPIDQDCLTQPVARVNNAESYLSGLSGDSWNCARGGVTAPITISAALWERDSGLLNPRAPDVLDRRGDLDDSVGRRTITFSAAGLAADLPGLSAKAYTFPFTGDGGHYQLTFVVARQS